MVQENRREYEKRVASIVEQSWLIFGDEAEGKEATKGGASSSSASAQWGHTDIYTFNLHLKRNLDH